MQEAQLHRVAPQTPMQDLTGMRKLPLDTFLRKYCTHTLPVAQHLSNFAHMLPKV